MSTLTPPDWRKTHGIHRRGTRAAQPAATSVINGTLYFVTDELIIERSTQLVWESYSGIGLSLFTPGSVPFAGPAGFLTEDNTNLFFDNAADILTVGPVTLGKLGANTGFVHLRDDLGTAEYRIRGTNSTGRYYVIGVSDGAGALRWGLSTGDSELQVRFSTDGSKVVTITPSDSNGILNFRALSGTVVFCPGEGGGDKKAQFGRRISDDNVAVGIQAEFWPRSGSSVPTIAQMAPGGASYQWRIENNGDMQFVVTSAKIYWAGRSRISSPADGNILLTNAAGTDFSRLQLGGTSASYPAIKRNATGVNIELADGSGYAPLAADTLTAIGTVYGANGQITSTILVPTVLGSVSASGDLTLQSTSHGTRGQVVVVDELELTAGQVTFPATQNPSSNPNTLDDYEEVTFTPIIGGAGGTSGQTYSQNTGKATKIGNLVVAAFSCILTNKGTITGAVQIQGLPYTSTSTFAFAATCAVRYANLATNWYQITAQLNNSSTVADIYGVSAAAGNNVAPLVTADINNNSEIRGTLIYQVD